MRHFDGKEGHYYAWRDSTAWARSHTARLPYNMNNDEVLIYMAEGIAVVKWTQIKEFHHPSSLLFYDVNVRKMLYEHASAHYEELEDVAHYHLTYLKHLIKNSRIPKCFMSK